MEADVSGLLGVMFAIRRSSEHPELVFQHPVPATTFPVDGPSRPDTLSPSSPPLRNSWLAFGIDAKHLANLVLPSEPVFNQGFEFEIDSASKVIPSWESGSGTSNPLDLRFVCFPTVIPRYPSSARSPASASSDCPHTRLAAAVANHCSDAERIGVSAESPTGSQREPHRRPRATEANRGVASAAPSDPDSETDFSCWPGSRGPFLRPSTAPPQHSKPRAAIVTSTPPVRAGTPGIGSRRGTQYSTGGGGQSTAGLPPASCKTVDGALHPRGMVGSPQPLGTQQQKGNTGPVPGGAPGTNATGPLSTQGAAVTKPEADGAPEMAAPPKPTQPDKVVEEFSVAMVFDSRWPVTSEVFFEMEANISKALRLAEEKFDHLSSEAEVITSRIDEFCKISHKEVNTPKTGLLDGLSATSGVTAGSSTSIDKTSKQTSGDHERASVEDAHYLLSHENIKRLMNLIHDRSTIAQNLRVLYVQLRAAGAARLTIYGCINCQVTTYRHKDRIPIVPPHKAIALLRRPEDVVAQLPWDASSAIRDVILTSNPHKSLEILSSELCLPLSHVSHIAQHLIYWRLAQVVEVVSSTDIYTVNSRIVIGNLRASMATTEYEETFPDCPLTLTETLTLFSENAPIADVRRLFATLVMGRNGQTQAGKQKTDESSESSSSEKVDRQRKTADKGDEQLIESLFSCVLDWMIMARVLVRNSRCFGFLMPSLTSNTLRCPHCGKVRVVRRCDVSRLKRGKGFSCSRLIETTCNTDETNELMRVRASAHKASKRRSGGRRDSRCSSQQSQEAPSPPPLLPPSTPQLDNNVSFHDWSSLSQTSASVEGERQSAECEKQFCLAVSSIAKARITSALRREVKTHYESISGLSGGVKPRRLRPYDDVLLNLYLYVLEQKCHREVMGVTKKDGLSNTVENEFTVRRPINSQGSGSWVDASRPDQRSSQRDRSEAKMNVVLSHPKDRPTFNAKLREVWINNLPTLTNNASNGVVESEGRTEPPCDAYLYVQAMLESDNDSFEAWLLSGFHLVRDAEVRGVIEVMEVGEWMVTGEEWFEVGQVKDDAEVKDSEWETLPQSFSDVGKLKLRDDIVPDFIFMVSVVLQCIW
eukprot:GHVN01051118.1.p1 GENE.GHVN01051118.1~~GHVN01051118.1.p1  ORF type:complete len:1101 (+),score=164.56 GHVN01051118.1:105-3407(+)